MEIQEKFWRSDPEWGDLVLLVAGIVRENRSRHPGIITERIIESLMDRYWFRARETHFPERRKNHPERIRRLSHQVFKALEIEDERGVAERIADLTMEALVPASLNEEDGGRRDP
jgi:hypothetical protein